MKIRAITLHEPWATAMVLKDDNGRFLKQIETRHWVLPPDCLNVPIAIAAAKTREHIKDWHHLVANAERSRSVSPAAHLSDASRAILALADAGVKTERDFSPGCVVGVTRFHRCRRAEGILPGIDPIERSLGGYDSCDDEPRFGWETDIMVPFTHPIPAKGVQGFWTWEVPSDLEPIIKERFGL